MDNRLTRGMDPKEAAEWKAWFKATPHLEPFQRVLEAALEAAFRADDRAETFSSPNALATLAHAAGYRQGIREALKLLTRPTNGS